MRLPAGRLRVGLDGQARDLREAAGGIGQQREPVLERALELGAGDVERDHAVAERQLGEDVAPGDRACRARRSCRRGCRRRSSPRRRRRADARMASVIRLPIAASRVRTVVLRLSSSTAVVPSGASSSLPSSCSQLGDRRRHLPVGRDRRGVDDAELRPPGGHAAAALLRHLDRHVDRRHVVRVVVRFDDGVAAVVLDEQVVGRDR